MFCASNDNSAALKAWAWVIAFSVRVQAIENKLAEEPKSDLACDCEVPFSFGVGEVRVIAGSVPRQVDVLPQFDVCFRAGNKRVRCTCR